MLRLPISVIVPTFNRKDLVLRALHSVLQQSILPEEIIAIDDGSTDGSFEMLYTEIKALAQHHASIIRLFKQKNQGVSAARNRGIRTSTAQWIAFLDSDDLWLPHKLEKQWQAIITTSDAKIVHSNEIWIRHGRRVNPMNKHRKYHGWIYHHCLPRCCISPSSVLVHRSVFERVGRFDESLHACEDYDMWLRVCAQFPVVLVEDQLVVKYGGHTDQLSRKYWGMDRFRVYALENMLRFGKLQEEFHRSTRYTLTEKLKILEAGSRKRGHLQQAEQYHAQLTQWSTQFERQDDSGDIKEQTIRD